MQMQLAIMPYNCRVTIGTFRNLEVPDLAFLALGASAYHTSTPAFVSATGVSAGAGIALTLAAAADNSVRGIGVRADYMFGRDVTASRRTIAIVAPMDNELESAAVTVTNTVIFEPDGGCAFGQNSFGAFIIFVNESQNTKWPVSVMLRDAVANPAVAARSVTTNWTSDVTGDQATSELICPGHPDYLRVWGNLMGGARDFNSVFGARPDLYAGLEPAGVSRGCTGCNATPCSCKHDDMPANNKAHAPVLPAARKSPAYGARKKGMLDNLIG